MAEVDQLYALPLEEFIPARDAAAKAIRKAGDREFAAVVAKLPKPTPAAWTANQVAREQPELIAAMLEAGAELREAQEAAVSGGGGRGLRDATLAERRAVDAVMTAAVAYRPAGRALSRAMADRLRTTLHAAAGDESIRDALAEGRLVDEAQAGGAWPFALEPSAPTEKPAKARAKKAAKRGAAKGDEETPKRGEAKTEADDDARERAAERVAAEREAAQRKALEAELREARGSLRIRERVFAGAEEDVEATKDAVNQARAALEQAQKAAEDAVAEAEAAQNVLAEARKGLDQARDDVARLEERLD